MSHKLRIAIDCRINNSQQGIGTALIALAKALSDSKRKDQQYTFVVREDMLDWLAPYVYGPCELAGIPRSAAPLKTPASSLKASLGKIAPLRALWHTLRPPQVLSSSDGYVESNRFDVVHFPTQMGYRTRLPSIYQPWDLQHVHYPQFFSKEEIQRREDSYRALCEYASYICVQAEWTKQDVVKHYGISPDKVSVIPWGSVFDAYTPPTKAVLSSMKERYALPDAFFFYPAVTWAHKNHEVILRALTALKKRYQLTPSVYFTGRSTEYRATLDSLAQTLGISDQVHFLGFLPADDLQALFSAATAMLFPSRFEGFGLPLLEAFHAHLPVISSNATTLPEVGGNAALYFDPESPVELAAAMKDILERPDLRGELIQKGLIRLEQHSIHTMAASFQDLYAKCAIRQEPFPVKS